MAYQKLIVLFLIKIVLLAGCSSSEIQGTVKDPFGNNMEGVAVTIEKSDLKSSTGKDGRYSIPYVLGTFTLKYSKPGYTTQKITLTIQEKTRFPAQIVTIYPIPTEPGLYYVGEKDLIKMSPGKIVIQEIREKTGDGMRDLLRLGESQVKFYPDKIMEFPFRPGKAQFIDRSSLQFIPMHLRGDGCFLQLLMHPSGLEFKVAYDGSVIEEKIETGEEKLLLRTINCVPGSYAWVEFSKDIFGRDLPKPKGTCYAFSVKSGDAAQSQALDNMARAISDVVENINSQEAKNTSEKIGIVHQDDLRREVEIISEKIRAAHLNKDINKWLGCYDPSYPNLGRVENKMLELWKNYDIKEVNYRISNVQRVSDIEASADIVWNIQLYDHRTHDYTLVRQKYQTVLEKGPGGWKIRDSKDVAGG